MGMLLRRRTKKPLNEPKVNGKPVVNPPKTKKLNNAPDYEKKETGIVKPTL